MSPPVAVPVLRFNAGETSPRVRGRSDLDWQPAGCEIMLNAIAEPQGPATMRPGGWYAGGPRVPDNKLGTVAFIPFIAAVDPLEAYVIEVTDQKLRFWYAGTRTQVMSGLSPLELDAPWLETEIASIRVASSRDVMWLVHPNHSPRKLSRTAVDVFIIAGVDYFDGPYYPITLGVNVTASDIVGAVTLTASSDLWTAEDVGRFWRFGISNVWAWGSIIGFTTAQNVTFAITGTLPGVGPTSDHRGGLWSARTGWPAAITFYQERLFYGTNPAQSFPRVDGSVSGDFGNFTPGTADTSPVSYTISSDELPMIRNLVADRTLLTLMSSAEKKIGSEKSTDPLTPTSPPQVLPISEEGTADTAALKIKGRTVFLNRYRRALFEIAYAVDADGLATREISIRADHIGDRQPFAAMTWQNRPHNLIWMWSANGSLAACTYTPEQSVIAPHRHRKAGSFQGGFARVETMCTVPGSKADATWMVVRRTINGQDVRHIEVAADSLHDDEPQDEACYLDAAVQARGEEPAADITFSEITDETVKILASDGVFASDDVGRRIFAVLEDLEDEMEDGQIRWRRVALEVETYIGPTVVVARLIASYLPPSNTIVAGNWRFGIEEVTNLDHLEGQMVAILADGAPLADREVVGGRVGLDSVCGVATVGLFYDMIVQPNEFDAGARQGTAHTRKQTVTSVGLQVQRSGPFKAGIKGQLYDANVRTGADLLDEAVPLLTGVHVIDLPQGDDERRVRWRVAARGPLPVTLVCAVPHQSIGEANQ